MPGVKSSNDPHECSSKNEKHIEVRAGCSTILQRIVEELPMVKFVPAYQGIERIHGTWMQEAIRAAPHYRTSVAPAINQTIGCIHGLQDLYPKTDLLQLEVYLGRATVTTLEQRWTSHANGNKKHRYGAILFCCDHDQVERLEDLAVRAITKLKAKQLLCVGNANKWDGNQGLKPRPELAVIYMTWRELEEEIPFTRPGIKEIRQLSTEIHQESPYRTTRGQLLRGLRILKRIQSRVPLRWWQPS